MGRNKNEADIMEIDIETDSIFDNLVAYNASTMSFDVSVIANEKENDSTIKMFANEMEMNFNSTIESFANGVNVNSTMESISTEIVSNSLMKSCENNIEADSIIKSFANEVEINSTMESSENEIETGSTMKLFDFSQVDQITEKLKEKHKELQNVKKNRDCVQTQVHLNEAINGPINTTNEHDYSKMSPTLKSTLLKKKD